MNDFFMETVKEAVRPPSGQETDERGRVGDTKSSRSDDASEAKKR